MTSGRIALVGGVAVIVVLAWVAVTRLVAPASADDGAGPGGASATTAPSPVVVASPEPSQAASPVPLASTGPSASLAPVATPIATPRSTPTPTKRPATTEDPRVAYAAFLARLDDDRRTATDLADQLVVAIEDGDRAAARSTAVDILQFADGEHDWLTAHPPADCYAAAHDAAGSMVEAYATVADRALDWVDAAPGLATLDALGKVIAAGSDARDAAATLAGSLEATTCLR
jgi:hypothetical protein